MNNQNNNNRNKLSHSNESKVNINGQMKILESKGLKKWIIIGLHCTIHVRYTF